MKTKSSVLGALFRRLLLIGGVALLGLYLVGVTAGYVWLHHLRHNSDVTFLNVAFFRVAAVRRGMAVGQFAAARKEADATNVQTAFLNYSTAVRNDPDNIAGRLDAADFLMRVGASNLALGMLEEGLSRMPDNRLLVTRTFDLLTDTGNDARALELLHGSLAPHFRGPNGVLLQTYEVLATLNAAGPEAAKKLLEQYPDLAKAPSAMRVVARVLWESAERLKAISLLTHYLEIEPGTYASYVQLADWQQSGGLALEAVQTAQRAARQFPAEPAPRVLLIEMLDAATDTRAAAQAAESYLRDFSSQPGAYLLLAESAGRRGRADLALALYAVGASHQSDLFLLGLYYSDALARNARYGECRDLLAQLEAQAPEKNNALMVQLRQRQVIMAAALHDPDNVREYARRLAAALRSNPEALEAARRNFQRMGIAGAVTELSSRTPAAPAAGQHP